MRGCGITPFFCVDKFYIHVDYSTVLQMFCLLI